MRQERLRKAAENPSALWSENAYIKYKQSIVNNAEVKTGNIYFNLNPNEDDEYCYWLDYLEAKGKIRRPKDPIREGYAFTGWYTESECVNIWDFECEVELAYLKSENEVVNINSDGYRFSEETLVTVIDLVKKLLMNIEII